MARQPRLHVPGGVYYVMLRGNGGQDIFYDDDDRYHLYLLIQQGVERYGHRIHAFCCMANHIHLALQVQDVPLSQIMQNLSFRYTRWINKQLNRSGHLFQGRYKAILVDADSYLLELVCYIHLNPLRANLVEEPVEYAWSSHRAYLGQEELPWLCTEWVLSCFAKRLKTCRQRYAAFVQAGKGEGYRDDFHQGGEDGRVLADDRFLQQVLAREEASLAEVSLSDIIRCVSTDYGVSDKELRGPSRSRAISQARGTIGWLARHFGSISTKEVAAYFNRDVSTLSRQIGKIEQEFISGSDFAACLHEHINAIMQADPILLNLLKTTGRW